MDKKRKRSLSDEGDNPKKKILKTDNVCIENSNYVDSEHSSVVSESQGVGEVNTHPYILMSNNWKISDVFVRNRYHDTTVTIGDNFSRDIEGNIIFLGPDGPISVPYLFYTTLWSILRELANNPRHDGTVIDDESDNSSVDTDSSQALEFDGILQSPYGPITVPRFFHSTLWSIFSELIKSPHRRSTPIGTESKSLSWDTDCEPQSDEHNIIPGEGSFEVPMFVQRNLDELTDNSHLGDTDVILLTEDEQIVPESTSHPKVVPLVFSAGMCTPSEAAVVDENSMENVTATRNCDPTSHYL